MDQSYDVAHARRATCVGSRVVDDARRHAVHAIAGASASGCPTGNCIAAQAVFVTTAAAVTCKDGRMGTRRRHTRIGVASCVALTLASSSAMAHAAAAQGLPPPQPIAPYRSPVIALVQPAGGASVPQDRPVIVFRFAAGDTSEPIDARSFAVTVDGKDRSALFQMARETAWGPLASERNGGPPIELGVHEVAARICSVRGACSEISATVTVSTSAAATTPVAPDRRRTLIDLLLSAAKKLLSP